MCAWQRPGFVSSRAGASRLGLPVNPLRFQSECVEAFVASWTARGFAASTIGNDIGVLERMLKALGHPAWEVTAEDVDRVVGDLAAAGRATSTRRNYLQVFKGFHRFLEVRKAAQIEAAFGVRLVCPVDEYNSSRHVSSDSPAPGPAADPGEGDGIFRLPEDPDRRGPQVRSRGPRLRLVPHALSRRDPLRGGCASGRPGRPFQSWPVREAACAVRQGRPHVGPRPRWVPMLDGLDLQLRWFLDDVRGRFPGSAVLFCDESGGQLATGTVRNRLRHLMNLEGRPAGDWFTPHSLRRACATHNYERGMDLVAIQQLLGHWTVASTMRYVRPSETFIEDAYRRAVSAALGELTEGE